jgi:hypothetical protein
MSDRELLELAALAAGIEHGGDRLDCGLSITLPSGRHHSLARWNPLEDDADALRLAVRLNLKVYQAETAAIVHPRMSHAYAGEAYDDNGMDKYAATRRAIVRAAAEIGRRMQHE